MNDMMNASVLGGYCDNGIINESFENDHVVSIC